MTAPAQFFPGQDLDTFTIGGDRTPGQCTLVKAPNIQRWDIRQGNALSGATTVPMGEDVNDVEFFMYFWTPEQVGAWNSLASKWFKSATVTAPAGLDQLALSIGYPLLKVAPISITKVTYKQCTELQIDEYEGYSCTVTFLKWRRPILAPARPKAAIPAAAVPKPTAKDAQQQVIQQQQGEIQREADRLFPGSS